MAIETPTRYALMMVRGEVGLKAGNGIPMRVLGRMSPVVADAASAVV